MKKVLKILSCILILTGLTLLIPVSGGCSEPEEKQNTFIKLLGLLPVTAKEERVITLIDYEKWRQVNGISVYDEDGQRVNREEYFERIITVENESSLFGFVILTFSTYWTGGLDVVSRSPIQNTTIGYEYSDIDAEISNS